MPINKIRPSKRAAAAIAAVLAMSVGGYVTLPSGYKVHEDTALAITALTSDWEGRRLVAYLDTIPKPPRWTICEGDTNNVKPGMVETPAGCDKRLAVKMERDYRPKLVACVPDWDNQPLAWRAAAIDLSWNLGPAGVCKSSSVGEIIDAKKHGRAPNYNLVCEDITKFVNSGGRRIPGLVLRSENGDRTRMGRGELCVTGIQP